MKIRWLGHASFHIEGSKQVVIDPWLDGNPACPIGVEELPGADVVLLTHDHFDHVADLEPVLKKTGATLVAIHEIAEAFGEKGYTTEGCGIGGTVEVAGIKVHVVNAVHSCSQGAECGFIVEMDGKQLYHLGDTGLFGDLALYGRWFDVDLAMVPIGDRYTMGPRSAAEAVRMIGCKRAIPIHYNTFPPIEQDPQRFVDEVGDAAEVSVLQPGETLELA